MAGFICHVFAGTKRFRLERIVRPALATYIHVKRYSFQRAVCSRLVAPLLDGFQNRIFPSGMAGR